MKGSNDILIELQSICPAVAGIEKLNVFTVPEGYFDSLNAIILSCINAETAIAEIPSAKQHFNVPDGYFDNLAAIILDKIKNTESTGEPETLSTLMENLRYKNVFEVPQGYFESLSVSIVNEAREEAVPGSLLLNKIGKKNIFETPAGYFEQLPAAILNKIKPVPGKVVIMRSWNRILKYSAAAIITGALALGVYKYTNTAISVNPDIVASNALDPVIEKGKAMNDEKFEETLNNLSEADIAKYLENTSTESDVSVLMSGVEENNLPNQDDYLTDERALENFLKEIDNQQLNN